MEIRFYPYDFHYRVEESGVYVYLHGVDEDGTTIIVKHAHIPYFYVKGSSKKELESLQVKAKVGEAKVIGVEKVMRELLGKMEPFWKVSVNYPKAVPTLAKSLEAKGVLCYERDILFVHRYLRDMKLVPMCLSEAKGEWVKSSGMRVPEFLAEEVAQIDLESLERWKILGIDIETYAKKKEIDPVKNPILMIALYGVNSKGTTFTKVLTWKHFEGAGKDVEIVSDEAAMIERFVHIVRDYAPHIITGYFSDGFDFPYIEARAHKHKIKLDMGADGSEMYIRRSAGFRSAQASFRGILHVDTLKFVKNIFGKDLKTESFSLNNVAHELLGSRKHDVNLNELSGVWDRGDGRIKEFVEYNLHDAKLATDLCVKLLPDMIELTKALGVPLYDVIRMRFSRLVESFILKRAIERDVLAPNKPQDAELARRRDEHIKGAFVFEPKPGLYEDLVVFDFRSLYPTIIAAHNLSPESISVKGKGVGVPGENTYFSEEKSFLPSVLEEVILRRVDVKRQITEIEKKGDDARLLEARSYTLKILANSFYGYLGFYGARWYSIEAAGATTAYARDYIGKAIELAGKRGFEVAYADTDSCFLLLGKKGLDKAMKFMKEVNKDLPGHMELEFEGYFVRGIFVSIKGSEKGAKKKYALLREDGTVKITGFEVVRRNWSELAKEAQKKVLRLVLDAKVDEALVYVRSEVATLLTGKVAPEKLILKTQITRDLSQYRSRGPHVIVAEKMVAMGEIVSPGTVVEYVIEEGEGLVRERAQLPTLVKKYDRKYYLHHQLIPAVESIFHVLGISEEKILGKAEQKGLGGFF